MASMVGEWPISKGNEVRTSDGRKLGKVIGFWPDFAEPTHLIVKKGFLFPRDYYVPVDVIGGLDGERVYLALTRAEAMRKGWEASPAGSSPSDGLGSPT